MGSGSLVPEQLQDLVQEPFDPIPDPGLFTLEVAGHVQRPDPVFRDPGRDVSGLECRARILLPV